MGFEKQDTCDSKQEFSPEWTIDDLLILMEEYKLSASSVAALLGLDQSTVTRWMHKDGHFPIPRKYAPRLGALRYTCSELHSAFGSNVPLAAVGIIACHIILSELSVDKFVSGMGLDHIECPFCAEIIKKKAVLCKHCQSKIG